jgi:hypothetical protein
MATVQEVQDLAGELQTARPPHAEQWLDRIPIVNHLLPWRHLPIDDLRAMTLAWAKDPGNRTPASLKYMPGVPPKTAGGDVDSRKSKQPRCYICGNTEADCVKINEWEVSKGLPDPHDFETSEQALANRSDRQWKDLERELEDAQRATRAKRRADQARAQIRPTRFSDNTILMGRIGETVRKCLGCSGTLAQTQQDHHPGCVPVDA